ncbi:MAG: hypothetical protein CL670_01830 [Balneola sp.]|nr:hypothetical protein [Balneola sp.]MBE77875.1 hypothetical protein [Balneola sp.]HBX65446.1 hypothetical protein [Balneolaceae bacterium]
MKRQTLLLVFSITLFIYSHGVSQTPMQKELPDMSAFVGAWIGVSGVDTLIVDLQLKSYFLKPLGKNICVLYGDYEYKSDSTFKTDSKPNEVEFPLNVGITQERDEREFIGFAFRDKELGKTGRLRLYVDEKNADKLEWRLSYGEGIYINATRAEIEERKRFSVPTEMTLYRRE